LGLTFLSLEKLTLYYSLNTASFIKVASMKLRLESPLLYEEDDIEMHNPLWRKEALDIQDRSL